jgi:HD-GYP domain-containing protein (c-di-GMP phosphodiesterase class II)
VLDTVARALSRALGYRTVVINLRRRAWDDFGVVPHEWAEMKRHPELGARILEHANLRDSAAWVRAHHERVDGRGYPAALAAGEIPLEASILAAADAYEAMTADRPYRRALSPEIAQEELRANASGQFDPAVVEAFLGVLSGDASETLVGVARP